MKMEKAREFFAQITLSFTGLFAADVIVMNRRQDPFLLRSRR